MLGYLGMELAFALPRLGAATLLMARRLSLGAWLPWGSLAMAVRRPAFVIRLPLLLSALRQRVGFSRAGCHRSLREVVAADGVHWGNGPRLLEGVPAS